MIRGRSQQSGFTIVELLVAGTIMVLILSALGSLFTSTNKAYRTNDELSEQQQSMDAAGQLLEYEIGLAGYRGSDNTFSSNTFTGNTLEVVKGGAPETSDKITVQYYEDRFGKALTKVTFEADKTDGIYNLYRTSGNKQPAVQNVKNLKVLKYIRKDGTEGSTATADTLAALKIELTFIYDGEEIKKQVVIGLRNPQTLILPTL